MCSLKHIQEIKVKNDYRYSPEGMPLPIRTNERIKEVLCKWKLH